MKMETQMKDNFSSDQLVELNTEPNGMNLINPYRTNKVDSMDLVSLAQEIQKADEFIRGNVNNKLKVLAEQAWFLQEQAKKILEEAKESYDLHHIACNFIKKPGRTYYIYERPSGQKYFSMLSPKEWGLSCKHKFLGGFRLESDLSWTPEERIEERQREQLMIQSIVGGANQPSITFLQQ